MSILNIYKYRIRSRSKWHNQPFPKELQEKILHPKRVNYRKLDESVAKRYDVPILVTDSQEFYEGKRSTPYRSRDEFDSILSTDFNSRFENTTPSFALETPKYVPSSLPKVVEYAPSPNVNQSQVEYNDHKDLDEQLNNISEIPVINESTYLEASKRKRNDDDEGEDDYEDDNILENQYSNSKSPSIYNKCQEIINKLDNIEGKKRVSIKPLKKRKKENELIRDVLKRKLSESITNSQNKSTPKKKSRLFIQQIQSPQKLENELKRSIEMESIISHELSKPLKEAKSDSDEMLLFQQPKPQQNHFFSNRENPSKNNNRESPIAKESYEENKENNNIQIDKEEEDMEDKSSDDIKEVKSESENLLINDNNDDNSDSSLSDEDFSFDSEEGSPKPTVKLNSININNDKEKHGIIVNNNSNTNSENEKNKINFSINPIKNTQSPHFSSTSSPAIEQNKTQTVKPTSPFSQLNKPIQISLPNTTKIQPFSSQSSIQPFNTQNNINTTTKISFGSGNSNNNNITSLFSMNEPKNGNKNNNKSSIFQQPLQNNNNNVKTDNKPTFGIKSKGKKLQIKRK